MKDFGEPISKILKVMSDKTNRSVLILLYEKNMTIEDLAKEIGYATWLIDNSLDNLISIGFVSHKVTIEPDTKTLFGFYTITALGKSFVDNLLKVFEEELKVDNIPN